MYGVEKEGKENKQGGVYGVRTTFRGCFQLDNALRPEQSAYLRRFAEMSHEAYNEDILQPIPDPLRALVGLPLGHQGMYFTGVIDEELETQLRDAENEIRMGNEEIVFPSRWCQWVPTKRGTGIEWDGEEKFYAPAGWLRFLIEHFLLPWGYHLSGSVWYEGEQGEHGHIVVEQDEVFLVDESDSLCATYFVGVFWVTLSSESGHLVSGKVCYAALMQYSSVREGVY